MVRRWLSSLVLLVAVLPAAACVRDVAPSDSGAPQWGGSGPLPVGRSEHSMSVDGTERTFGVYRPAGTTRDSPTVLVLHGGYGTGAQVESRYDWDAAADKHGFVAVFPDGWRRSWNAGGGCCGAAGREGVPDVAYLQALVARLPIDREQVYAVGMSNGGMLAQRLACESDLLAGVAVVAATTLVGCQAPAALSVLDLHGTDDEIVRYDGERGDPYGPRSDPVDGLPVEELHDLWRRAGGCGPDTLSQDGHVVVRTATCPSGRRVVLRTYPGVGHTWPADATETISSFITGLG